MPERRRAQVLAVFALACVAEVAVITVQAWRRVPSHFNQTTPVNAAFAFTAAGGGALIIATGIVLTVAALRGRADVPASQRLALRVGFLLYLAGLGLGAFMIFKGVRTIRTVSQAAAYTVDAPYKPGHEALLYGVLILPGLARLLAYTRWTERRRLIAVATASAVYTLAASTVLVHGFG